MRVTLGHSISYKVQLHCEDFYNNGITPEEAREAIEKTRCPFLGNPLRPQKSAIYRNWEFSVYNENAVDDVVFEIEMRLNRILKNKTEA